ncbi:RNA-binding S4 domain-containing protein [uncultured Phycicoccus sp.]|uniref:RNA-binding S4 domain-containing protein n=1 Tax=uncultured Phycicoccus sp. TaxID=661422 RepID=UPI002629649F|nr:RNA-binding S4 domain-containing protein [uncultured Phycicoccus sp.]
MTSEPFEVPIRDESIRLGQLLKLASLVEDGATAREVVERGLVTVNGDVETRRGRQVRVGDVVGLDGGESVRVVSG